MNMKKFFVITPIVALLCIAMFASLGAVAVKAEVVPLNSTYLAYVVNTSIYGTGHIYNSGYIVGQQDGYYAVIAGTDNGAGGEIEGQMSTTVNAYSTIAIQAFSSSGTSTMIVYIATSSTGPWTWVGSQPVTTGTWYYFTAPSAFTYVAVAGYNPNTGENLNIDCVVTM
jgi:hypothetical protein